MSSLRLIVSYLVKKAKRGEEIPESLLHAIVTAAEASRFKPDVQTTSNKVVLTFVYSGKKLRMTFYLSDEVDEGVAFQLSGLDENGIPDKIYVKYYEFPSPAIDWGIRFWWPMFQMTRSEMVDLRYKVDRQILKAVSPMVDLEQEIGEVLNRGGVFEIPSIGGENQEKVPGTMSGKDWSRVLLAIKKVMITSLRNVSGPSMDRFITKVLTDKYISYRLKKNMGV